MLTTKANANTWTIHVVGRDGVTALCRRNIKAYRFEGGTMDGQHLTYRLPGDDFARSCDQRRTNCDGCRAKLNTAVADAWDAAHAEQDTRNAGPRTRTFTAAKTALAKVTPAQRDALLGSHKIQGVRVLDGRVRVSTVLALRDKLALVDTTTQRFEFDSRRHARLSQAGIMAVAVLRHGEDAVREWAQQQDAAAREALEDRQAAERDALRAQQAAELAALEAERPDA